MRWLGKERFRFFRGQDGFTLIETIIAVAILAGIGMAVLFALDTNSRANRVLDEQVQAINLATAYFEVVRQFPYDTTSDPYSSARDNITIPFGYSVDTDISYSDDGTTWVDTYTGQTLQRITVIISREGGKPVFSTCTFRTER